MGSKINKKIKNYLGRNFNRARTPDKQSLSSRSSQMSKIRSKNTKFEEEFINLLRKEVSVKFTTHERTLKGNPDIVFSKKKICIFLDSDFWHGWQYPRWKHLLKDNFWREKIYMNRKRDVRNSQYLKRHGWKVVRLWEHQIRNFPVQSIKKIQTSIKD